MPPRTRPRAKPIGCPPPRKAKAILRRFPVGKLFVIRLTAVGMHNDMAIPCKALNTMS